MARIDDIQIEKGIKSDKNTTRTTTATIDEMARALGVKTSIFDVYGLSDEDIKFIYYLVDNGGDKLEAYKDSYAARSGRERVKDKTLERKASAIMKRPEVLSVLRLCYNRLLEEMANNLDAVIIRTYILRATYDVFEFYKEDGSVKDLNEIKKKWRTACIDGITNKVVKGKEDDWLITEYKLPNKTEALKYLGEYIKLIDPDKTRLTDSDDSDEEVVSDDTVAAMSDEEIKKQLQKMGVSI